MEQLHEVVASGKGGFESLIEKIPKILSAETMAPTLAGQFLPSSFHVERRS